MHNHDLKVMEFIDRIVELIGEQSQPETSSDNDLLENLQPSFHALVSKNNFSVDRHLVFIKGSVQIIRGGVENADFVDAYQELRQHFLS